ncbi:MAG: hypothetical protein ABSG17_01275 [Spirochaetia bacterium]|jgi:hypothetical protein
MSVIVTSAFILSLLVGTVLAGSLLYLAFFLPFSIRSVRLLPKEGRTTTDGVTKLVDAVREARDSGLTGLPLVAHVQQLAARKYRYSRRNPWDSWERSFERGMGYCIQMTMALKLIFDRLGIVAWPVQSLRCGFPPSVIHGVPQPAKISGHMWLRVRVDGHDYDVCPGNAGNTPGVTHFKVMAPVRPVPRWLVPVLHIFSAAENVRRDWKNLFPRMET